MKNNKSNKIIKNLLFVFLVILIIIGICFINYKTDPYGIFSNKSYMQINNIPREMIYIIMKGYKNDKSDTVIIGGSETGCLFNIYFQNYFNNISIQEINYSQYKEILDAYLKLHPETKKVIIVLSYTNAIYDINVEIPKFEKTNFTFKEYQRVLFSTEATKQSLLFIKNYISYWYHQIFYKEEIDRYIFAYYPKQVDKYKYPKEKLKKLEEKNFKEIENIIKMLEEKELDYIFIIPPYNAIFMSLIYDLLKESQKNIDNFRRFIVSVVPEDKKIYDFAFINKYTSSDLYTNKDGLYISSSHPSIIFGSKIFRIIYNDEKADNDIYFLLNKNNIEFIIKKEKKLIEEYIKNNQNSFKYYKELSYTQKDEYLLYEKKIYKNSLSDDSKEEYEFLEKLINNNYKK